MSAPSPASDSPGDSAGETLPATPHPLLQPTYFHVMSYLVGLLTALLLVGAAVLLLRRPDPPPIQVHAPPTPAPTATVTPTSTPGPLVVFVSGAVYTPGIYTLTPPARIGDALAAAGGLLPDADSSLVNQATLIYDGAQIHVPEVDAERVSAPPAGLSGEAPAAQHAPDSATTHTGGLINLNSASDEDLQTLPGIGPSKAAAIIANRPYNTVDDLDRVPGIGPSTLDQLRNLVTTQ